MVVVVVRWSLFRGELYLERINVNVNKEHSDDIQIWLAYKFYSLNFKKTSHGCKK